MSRAPLFLLLALAPPPAAAQVALPPPSPVADPVPGAMLRPGDRVRVHWRSERQPRLVGTWLGVEGSDGRVEVPAGKGGVDTTLVPLEAVALLERSTGRTSRIGAGIGIGGLVGLGLGAMVGLASGDDESGFMQYTAGQKALAGAILGGAVGGLIGGVAGASSAGDRWQVVPLVRPTGAGAALTIRF